MNKRQKITLNKIKEGRVGIGDILTFVNQNNKKKVSKITVIRDLDELIKLGLIIREGKGPAVKYNMSSGYKLFEDIDIKNYFLNEADQRNAKNKFNFDIFDILESNSIFNKNETEQLQKLNKKYQKNIKNLPQEIIKREFERLMIELSWKSSRIEGNTYDLLETEFLIKENKEAEGHTRLEAQMILNHKDALQMIKKERRKKISVASIKKVHNTLTKKMGISDNMRNKPVGITGTIYRPLEASGDIERATGKLCKLINDKNNVFEKSLLLNLLVAYIQPFNDGNKRTSRLMGNAVLIANKQCPLSFRSIDELEYKKAVIIFYEQNNINYFKELFIEQFRFAVDNYFLNKT